MLIHRHCHASRCLFTVVTILNPAFTSSMPLLILSRVIDVIMHVLCNWMLKPIFSLAYPPLCQLPRGSSENTSVYVL
ncbi:hypothetical protein V8C37DRAFT_386652 [Trichoderma ceciliae]